MANTFTLISSSTVSSPTTTVTFSSIPQTYKDLCLIFRARNTVSASFVNILGYANTSSTSHYFYTRIYGNASAVTASSNTTDTRLIGTVPGAAATANFFGLHEIYWPNYTQTGYAHQYGMRSSMFSTYNDPTNAWMYMQSVYYTQTVAINTLTILADSGNHAVGSTFYLYGISNT